MGYSNLANPGNYQQAVFGQKGFKHLHSGTTLSVSGNFNSIQVLADSTVTLDNANGDDLTSVPVPAGMTIVGKFTTVTIAPGGRVLAYNG